MRSSEVNTVVSFLLLGWSLVFTGASGGKKSILIKIHVPKYIKQHHHTHIVLRHKHHHLPGHKKHPEHKNHHHYGYDHSYHHGEPYSNHSHSYDRTFGYGHGGDHHHHFQSHGGNHHHPNRGRDHHHPQSHGGDQHHLSQGEDHHKPSHDGGHHKNHKPKPKYPKVNRHKPKQYSTETPKNSYSFEHTYTSPPENHFSYNSNLPGTKTQRYSYYNYSPSFNVDDKGKVKEVNQTIKHVHTKIETSGNYGSEEAHSGTPAKGTYEVQEEQPEDYYSPDHGEQLDSQDSNEPKEDYFEDYTNPYSVQKYTSAIQHGSLSLEDSNYNPEHGNGIQEYIQGYGDYENN